MKSMCLNKEKAHIPYETFEEQMEDCLALLDLYLQYAYNASLQQKKQTTVPEYLQSVVVTQEQVKSAIIERFAGKPEISKQDKDVLEGTWEYIENRIPKTIEGRPNILEWIFGQIYPQHFYRLCFLLGMAHQWDSKYDKIYRYLQGSLEQTLPTIRLAYYLSLFTDEVKAGECLAFPTLGFRWNICFQGEPQGLNTSLELRKDIFFSMIGREALDYELRGYCSTWNPLTQVMEPPIIRAEMIEEFCEIEQQSVERDLPTVLLISGEVQSGRHFLIKHMAAAMKQKILYIDMDNLETLDLDTRLTHMESIAVACILHWYLPVIRYNRAAADRKVLNSLFQVFYEYSVYFAVVLTTEPLLEEKLGAFIGFSYRLNRLRGEEAYSIWKALIGELENEELDLHTLAVRYRMTPGQIKDVTERMRLQNKASVSTEDLRRIIRETISGQALHLCKKVTPIFTMEDLILPETVKGQIKMILQRIQDEEKVMEQWGFGAKYAYGKGIGILLYGKPGTGKSMCAHVLAKELGLDLLQVDIASIVSKYIGETEKNLSDIFKQAEKTNAILFFDEADSLFAKRSADMTGSNDKYANIETAHLLQKLEEYSGICILTTNMAMNFDKAFFRRFEYIVNIPNPDAKTRIVVWQRAFPEKCPLEAGLSFTEFANQLELSPSEIKKIARDAAFIALYNQSKVIGMEHVLEALKIDYQKNGKSLPAFFSQ